MPQGAPRCAALARLHLPLRSGTRGCANFDLSWRSRSLCALPAPSRPHRARRVDGMSASPLPEMDAPQMPSTALPPASLAARPTQWSIAVLACAVARRRDALMHLAPLLPLALLLV